MLGRKDNTLLLYSSSSQWRVVVCWVGRYHPPQVFGALTSQLRPRPHVITCALTHVASQAVLVPLRLLPNPCGSKNMLYSFQVVPL